MRSHHVTLYDDHIMASQIEERIVQWEKMTQEAPDGMAWLSLANAYRDAQRDEDAVRALREAIKLDEDLSRAYQLLGQTLIKLEQDQEAGDVLVKGFEVAAKRGDFMPQKAIGSLLEQLDRPLPEVQAVATQSPVAGGQVLDRRTGRTGTRLPDPPIRGALGQFIYDHYSQETWREWIGMGTKVINELRLDFSNQAHQQVYDQQMLEWLGVSQDEVDEYARQTEGTE